MKKTLLIEWETLEKKVCATLDEEFNYDLCQAILSHLPISSMMGHVVISGETCWFPTTIVYLDKPSSKVREIGDLYLFPSGQSICMTYGDITESAKVFKFAYVNTEDFQVLKEVGKAVLEKTVYNAQREEVPVKISLIDKVV